MLYALEAFPELCGTLYLGQLQTKSCGMELIRTLFQAFVSKKEVVQKVLTPLWNVESHSWTKINDKQASNARRTAGELLVNFQKIQNLPCEQLTDVETQ